MLHLCENTTTSDNMHYDTVQVTMPIFMYAQCCCCCPLSECKYYDVLIFDSSDSDVFAIMSVPTGSHLHVVRMLRFMSLT